MEKIKPLFVIIKSSDVDHFDKGEVFTFQEFERIAHGCWEENTEDVENKVRILVLFDNCERLTLTLALCSDERGIEDHVFWDIKFESYPPGLYMDNFLRKIDFTGVDYSFRKTVPDPFLADLKAGRFIEESAESHVARLEKGGDILKG